MEYRVNNTTYNSLEDAIRNCFVVTKPTSCGKGMYDVRYDCFDAASAEFKTHIDRMDVAIDAKDVSGTAISAADGSALSEDRMLI